MECRYKVLFNAHPSCCTCRTLYDCDEQEEFLESLSTRIKNHEKDIERMCNKNYQWFIESVSELHKVKSEANKIKVRLLEMRYVAWRHNV